MGPFGPLYNRQDFIRTHWQKFSATGGVFYLQECRNPHTNKSLRTSSTGWVFPVFRWVTNKESHRGEPHLNLSTSDRGHSRSSSAEKDAEGNEHLKEVCFRVSSLFGHSYYLTLIILSYLGRVTVKPMTHLLDLSGWSREPGPAGAPSERWNQRGKEMSAWRCS